MAITVTLTGVEDNVPSVSQTGREYTAHKISYVNNGKAITRNVLTSTALGAKVAELKTGDSVDLAFTQKDGRNMLSDVAAAGSIAVPFTGGGGQAQQSTGAGGVGVSKDLSMELGGLMHDAVELVSACRNVDGSTKVRSVHETLQELVKIKRTVANDINTKGVELITAQSVEVAATNIEDLDDGGVQNPF